MYGKLAYIGFASYYLGSIVVECGGGECYDINGRTISPGFHFVPGPDTCTLCVCDNGNPKWCKAVLCSPPQDCKSFRVGNSCCEFICLDDTFGGGKGHPHDDLASEFGLRLIAGAITAILCLSIVFFSIHRLRQRKIRGREPQLHHHSSHLAQVSHHHGVAVGDPHDSAAGYLAAAAGGLRFADCGDDDDVAYLSDLRRPPHYTLWKPAAYAVSGLPRGQEAPPPYEEAVAAAQVEAALAAAAAAANASANSAATSGASLLLHHQHTISHHPSSHHISEHRTIPLTLATSDCLFAPTPQPPQSGATNESPQPQRAGTVGPQPHRGGTVADSAPVAPPSHRAPVAPQHRGTVLDSQPVAPSHRGSIDLAPVAPPHRGTLVDLQPVAPSHRGSVVDAVAPPHRGTGVDSQPVAPPHRGTVADSVAPLVLLPPPRVTRHNVATSTSSCSMVAPPRRTSSSNAPPTASIASQATSPHHPTLPSPCSDVITITKPTSDVTKPPPLVPTAAPQNNSRGRTADSVGNTGSSSTARGHATAHASCGTTSSAASRLATISVPHPPHHTMAMTSIAEEEQDVEGEEEEEEEDEEDYRSECENCNLTVSGGMNEADCFVDDLETMTLHRKPQDHCHLAMHQRRLGGHQSGGVNAQGGIGEWTSLTLPTNTRTQRPTSVLCNSSQTSARENWFSSMPHTSSESSEEEEEEEE